MVYRLAVMTRAWVVGSVAAATAVCPAPARADDRGRAAEAFALGQQAESQGDWRAAIDSYERAYQLSPHPSVLFNIGNSYERLAEYRTAARYFLRYVEDSPTADDRDDVLARVRRLREQPSKVSVECRQDAVTVHVDGEPSGGCPLELDLPAGQHRMMAERSGERSPTQTIVVEYGEPRSVTLDIEAVPGVLRVDCNVNGAEIRLDGNVIGATPFYGQVVAGDHVVAVGMAGYQSVERSISVPARGSEQVRVALVRAGQPPGSVTPPPEQGRPAFVIATAYGYNAAAQDGGQLEFLLGYRGASNRIDGGIVLGKFGEEMAKAAGAEVRLFLFAGALRPFLRASALAGRGEDDRSAFGAELGAGILWSAINIPRFGYELFLEANALVVSAAGASEGEPRDTQLSFPVLLGLGVHFGR